MSNDQNLKELKEHASMAGILAQLGYQPARQSRHEKMYRSMLRDDDSTPSFSVNDELGVWFDHGTRRGGNLIDFGLAYWPHLNFPQVVEKLMNISSIQPMQIRPLALPRPVKTPHYVVYETKDIGTHPAITNYLKFRGIFKQARNLLSEVYYYVEDQKGERKAFFAAGWKNENGSWEVRNKFFKGTLGQKGISVVSGQPKNVAVFEGFINYLSWKKEHPAADHSAIVLNTTALINIGIERAKAFSSIDIFFDRDNSGVLATQELIKALPYATDRSNAYEDFNDYNDKIVSELSLQQGQDNPAIIKRSFRI